MKLFVYTRTQKKRYCISFGSGRTFIGYTWDDHLYLTKPEGYNIVRIFSGYQYQRLSTTMHYLESTYWC